jgi:hypothetical protein
MFAGFLPENVCNFEGLFSRKIRNLVPASLTRLIFLQSAEYQ